MRRPLPGRRTLPFGPSRQIMLAFSALLIGLMISVVTASGTARADWVTDCVEPFTATYDASNMPNDLNLSATDKILIADGTFSGNVSNQLGTICVDTPATFNPANINGATRLFVRGTANMPPLAAGSGAVLDNEGSVTFTGTPNQNGVADILNRAGGTIVVNAAIPLGSSTTVINDGVITVNGGVTMNGPGTTVTNNNILEIVGPMNVSGTLTNPGSMTVSDVLQVNGGSTVVNGCDLQAGALINNASFTNNGVLRVDGEHRNNGQASYTQGADAFTSGATFTNDGLINGSGQYLFSGDTNTTGTMSGSSADVPIIFYDETQTGDQVLDLESGTITNVIRTEVTEPTPGACSVTPPPPPTTTTTTTATTSTTTTSTTEVPTTDDSTPTTETPPSTDDPSSTTETPPTTDDPTTSSDTGSTADSKPSTTSSSSLPSTGSSSTLPALAMAVLLLTVGFTSIAVARRSGQSKP